MHALGEAAARARCTPGVGSLAAPYAAKHLLERLTVLSLPLLSCKASRVHAAAAAEAALSAGAARASAAGGLVVAQKRGVRIRCPLERDLCLETVGQVAVGVML